MMKDKGLRKVSKICLITSSVIGIIFIVLSLLALTPAPFYMHYSLGTDPNKSEEKFTPEYIIMLGGGGMPSADNLMRLYYTAEYSEYFKAPIIILHPEDSVCQSQMRKELISKRISNDSIFFLTEGTNTRAQVLNLKNTCPELINDKLLIITSPEHLTRTIKCFNKLGFQEVRGQSAFEAVINFKLSLEDQELLGNKYIPEINNTNIRYTFWNYLKLEITCFREYIALAYYKLKGWN
ncbi:YdcF family protein [Bacteroidales bacterium OttesenSCG-928-K03]|nr:YdcF family protein [Bacteroidales bacterium OttesenSCG-928-L14]MDL2240393.1 YdcF family protein [Bacteroidales bacterium OttesenSCG-928-K22]MDL2242368.1 YdcF family protein [Bacteroidales bacterium OttesenSCG-928-K03]